MYIAIFPRSHGSEGKKVKIGLGRHLPMEHNVTALRCAVLCCAVLCCAVLCSAVQCCRGVD
jgi:hypothetical protein